MRRPAAGKSLQDAYTFFNFYLAEQTKSLAVRHFLVMHAGDRKSRNKEALYMELSWGNLLVLLLIGLAALGAVRSLWKSHGKAGRCSGDCGRCGGCGGTREQ